MARTRAVPRRRPNINFQQRGNIDFERQRVAATRNISSSESSASASPATATPARSPARSPAAAAAAATPVRSPARSPAAATPARSPARSPLGNLARNLARDLGRNPQRNQARSPPLRRRIRTHDVKIKFVLPRVKNIEVKHNGRVKSCKTRCKKEKLKIRIN